jgi:hypothetical protein
MVHALEAVLWMLRRGGTLVDIQPDLTFQGRVLVGGPAGRVAVGTTARRDSDYVRRAHAVIDRAVGEGSLALITQRRERYLARFRDLAEFDEYLRTRMPPTRVSPGTRPRLERAWRTARGPVLLERAFTLTVLRRL